MKESFENGVGAFYSDYVQKWKPMRVRFISVPDSLRISILSAMIKTAES